MGTTKNDNFDRLFWLLLLFMMAQNINHDQSFESATTKFQNRLDSYLEDHASIMDKAKTGSQLWQLKELKEIADGIGDDNGVLKLRTLMVASTIIDFIEKVGLLSCVME